MTRQKSIENKKADSSDTSKRTYIRQSDVPLMTLDEALRIPQAILDHYAGKPTLPLYVAKALSVDPKGSQFKFISGAAIAYGLIEGGAQASSISVTNLSKRILRPKSEGEDFTARREAVLTPRIFKEFLTNYDGNPFPRQDLAFNVLEDMGVPREKADEVLQRIENCAKSVGFLEEIKGKLYVTLQKANLPSGDNVDMIEQIKLLRKKKSKRELYLLKPSNQLLHRSPSPKNHHMRQRLLMMSEDEKYMLHMERIGN